MATTAISDGIIFPIDLAKTMSSLRTADLLGQWKRWIVIALLIYPLLIAFLRYRRVRAMPKKYGYTTRESLSKMTTEDAYAIQIEIAELEFPSAYEKALQFALFKVCNS